MMTYNLKTLVTMFVLGLLIGFCSSLLLYGCNDTNTNPAVTIIPPKEIKKRADNTAAIYREQITALQNKNRQLETELKTTKTLLTLAKQKTTKREAAIKQLIEPKGFPAKELLQRVNTTDKKDSSMLPCDSLKQEVKEYLQENALKDSLYQSQVNMLDSTVAIKDTIIVTQAREQGEINLLFTQTLEQQELLFGENKQLRKQARRQKFIGTLKTIGLMILSGAATRYLINR